MPQDSFDLFEDRIHSLFGFDFGQARLFSDAIHNFDFPHAVLPVHCADIVVISLARRKGVAYFCKTSNNHLICISLTSLSRRRRGAPKRLCQVSLALTMANVFCSSYAHPLRWPTRAATLLAARSSG